MADWVELPLPLGVNSIDTTFADSPGCISSDKMRPWLGRWQVIGGWQKLINTALTGVCRGAFGWTDYASRLNLIFGTHSHLMVLRGGALTDITPLRPNETLTNPFAMTDTEADVVVTHRDHQLTTAQSVTFSGASAAGGITINGAYTVTVVDDNSYTITHSSPATSTTTGGGTVTVAAAYPLKTGRINGAGGAGFGTGAYGVGAYGQPSYSDYHPRTWSFGASGETPYACPRGNPIFHWDNNTSNRATRLTNCPDRVEYMLVAPTGQVMALGCTNEDGDFDPLCIRVSDGVDRTIWTTGTGNNARQYVLEGSGYIIGARVVGSYVVAWTDNAIYWGRYTGSLDGWIFDLVADHRGLIGPLAACVYDQTAYWIGMDRKPYAYTVGGTPTHMPSPVQDELDAMVESQRYKVVLSTLTAFGEVWAFIPGASLEIERALSFNHSTDPASPPLWATHDLARTWFMDSGPTRNPIGVDFDGAIYNHERGNSANGDAFAWSVRTKAQYLAKGKQRMFVSALRPDVEDQEGAYTLNFHVRDTPQGAATTYGPYTLMVGDEVEDFFFEGRLVEVEISGEATPTGGRFGAFSVEMQPAGEY